MPGSVLYFLYLIVMTGGLFCFLQAFRRRFTTPVHKRWALLGTGLSLGGIGVVLAAGQFLGWTVEVRFPGVVLVHRRVALVAVALLLATATTGMLRIPIHKKLYLVFLPLYAATLVLAIIGYRP